MELLKAEPRDFDRITEFYRYVVDHTEDMARYGRWIYGLHPTDELIRSYVEGGYMYYSESEGKTVAAVALTPFQEEDYHGVEWSLQLNDDEVCVVHILCVDPSLQKTGVAKKVMDEAVRIARTSGKKALRLDALCCNEPAHRLYEKYGFTKCAVRNWYTCNAGWIDFYLYELNL